jgi:hypothetical protein
MSEGAPVHATRLRNVVGFSTDNTSFDDDYGPQRCYIDRDRLGIGSCGQWYRGSCNCKPSRGHNLWRSPFTGRQDQVMTSFRQASNNMAFVVALFFQRNEKDSTCPGLLIPGFKGESD